MAGHKALFDMLYAMKCLAHGIQRKAFNPYHPTNLPSTGVHWTNRGSENYPYKNDVIGV